MRSSGEGRVFGVSGGGSGGRCSRAVHKCGPGSGVFKESHRVWVLGSCHLGTPPGWCSRFVRQQGESGTRRRGRAWRYQARQGIAARSRKGRSDELNKCRVEGTGFGTAALRVPLTGQRYLLARQAYGTSCCTIDIERQGPGISGSCRGRKRGTRPAGIGWAEGAASWEGRS